MYKFSYNLKIDKLRQMISNKQIIGLELIKMIDDEKFIEYIHNKSQNIISQSVTSFSSSTKEYDIVLISTAIIALLEYDKNFYSFVEEKYSELYRKFNSVKINNIIREILKKYVEKTKFNTKRPINGALINTIVPQKYLSNFFEFIFDIYKVNFNYTVPENIEEEFRFVYEGIRNKFDYNSEEFVFGQIISSDGRIEKKSIYS